MDTATHRSLRTTRHNDVEAARLLGCGQTVLFESTVKRALLIPSSHAVVCARPVSLSLLLPLLDGSHSISIRRRQWRRWWC